MDADSLDSLVLERLLGLVRDLKVATEDVGLSLLYITPCLQTHLNLQWLAEVAVCTDSPAATGAPEDAQPSQICALLDGEKWRKVGDGRKRLEDTRRGTFSRPSSGPTICYRCGLPGHIYKSCRAEWEGPHKASSFSSGPTSAQSGPQQYHPYLYGRRFEVRSDHGALQHALRVERPSGLLSRWLEVL
ncbi:unnamed protein product [Lampetra fluviatilis]